MLLELRRDFRSGLPDGLQLSAIRIAQVDPAKIPWQQFRFDSIAFFHRMSADNDTIRATCLGVIGDNVYGLFGPRKVLDSVFLNRHFCGPAINVLRYLRDAGYPHVNTDTRSWSCGTEWLRLIFNYLHFYTGGTTEDVAPLGMPDGTVQLEGSLSHWLEFGSLMPSSRPSLNPEAKAAGVSIAFDCATIELLTGDLMLASADAIERILCVPEARANGNGNTDGSDGNTVTPTQLVQVVSELRVVAGNLPPLVRTGDSELVKQRKQQRHNQRFTRLEELSDEAVDLCEQLLHSAGPGVGTAMRELVRRHTTSHGREHNPFDDELLATVIAEAMEFVGVDERVQQGQRNGRTKVLPNLRSDPKAPYMPPEWFRDTFGIPAPRLRAARRDGRLAAIDVGTKRPRYQYSVPDAIRLWPDDGIYLPDASI